MDWHTQLITLYLAVCKYWQEVGWALAQRHAPYADLGFTDEEVVTIYLFAVALEEKQRSARSRASTSMPGAIGATGFPGCPATGPMCSA